MSKKGEIIKRAFIILAFLLITACAYQPKCVDIVYFHDMITANDMLRFKGEYYSNASGFGPMVLNAKQALSKGQLKDNEKCVNDLADIKHGTYLIGFNVGDQMWTLRGECWGHWCFIHPNRFSEKCFNELKDREQYIK